MWNTYSLYLREKMATKKHKVYHCVERRKVSRDRTTLRTSGISVSQICEAMANGL